MHQIPAAGLFGRAVIGQLGVEETEALVVLGGHDHVLLAGPASELRPVAGGVGARREAFGELFVLRYRNAFVLHHPLVPAHHAVQAPMHEHAESGVVPPFHATGLIGSVGRGSGGESCRGGGQASACQGKPPTAGEVVMSHASGLYHAGGLPVTPSMAREANLY